MQPRDGAALDRYVAFLRGINLGNRRIKNDELRVRFEDLGCAEVATFRASGNVIFAAPDEATDELSARLEAGLGAALGYEVPVFLRSGAELLAIAAREPFTASHLAASTGKPQVALLDAAPPAAVRRQVLSFSSEQDRLAIEGRELYWLPRGGISGSELDWKAIGAAGLGPTTVRTKVTIDQFAAKHFG